MNIWDSVQRGLEKATHEAGRIAKTQRLRAALEGLSKQIETQQAAIIGTSMELFKNGQLTQHELLLLCQELSNSQQQLAQVQSELKAMQNQSNANNTQAIPSATTVAYTQPPYEPYENTQPDLVPPPPPGFEPLTVSSLQTMRAPLSADTTCRICQAPLVPGNAFCHNCGTPVNIDAALYQRTIRSTADEGTEDGQGENTVLDVAEQSTVRADEVNRTGGDTPYDEGN